MYILCQAGTVHPIFISMPYISSLSHARLLISTWWCWLCWVCCCSVSPRECICSQWCDWTSSTNSRRTFGSRCLRPTRASGRTCVSWRMAMSVCFQAPLVWFVDLTTGITVFSRSAFIWLLHPICFNLCTSCADGGSEEKDRIEVKQRAAAAERKKRKENWKPRYSIQRKIAFYTNMHCTSVRDVLQS